MRISDDTIQKVLVSASLLTEANLKAINEEAKKSRRSLQEVVIQREIVSEEELTKLYANYIKIPFAQIDPRDIPSDVLSRIPERIARQYNAVLFKLDEDGMQHLAVNDPDDVQALDFIQKQIGENVTIHMATLGNILACLENYRGDVDKELSEVIDVQRVSEEDEKSSEAVTSEEVAEDSPIAQTINLLLEYAIKSNASDIHIEPREDFVQVRYRIDGVLREVNRLPINVQNALISRVKILSNLKIDERRVPQDGRFKIKVGGRQYALRVSTLPISDGEKVVMRILDESNRSVTLGELGYWGKSLEVMHAAMSQPNGMVLVTGPTGSGKSTSLFSALSMLNTPNVNISTIEDPVEYKIPGVNQVQTNPKAGMTFATGLRALLRQDPNIIMVGEIRDGETANLGVQAALTGHLVFSTLHTNNAATALPRLLDMQIEPFLIASTVKAIVGQRLVRRIDHTTRKQYTPSSEELEFISRAFNLKSPDDYRRLHELEKQAQKEGVGGEGPLSTDETGIKFLWQAEPSEDNSDGYKGRIGIYEVLDNTNSIQKLIMASATSNEIQTAAITEGMITMQTDGLIKALRGDTTIEEVMRVTRE